MKGDRNTKVESTTGMKHLLFTLIFVWLFLNGNSQTLKHKDIRGLGDRICAFLNNNDSKNIFDGPAEYLEIFLKLDSVGQITSMNILADQRNLGNLYNALTQIPVSVFNGWQVPGAKNRTIIFPVVCMPSEGCPQYILDLIQSRGDGSPYFTTDKETKTTIALTTFYFWQHVTKN